MTVKPRARLDLARSLARCPRGASLAILLCGIGGQPLFAQSPSEALTLGPAQLAGDGASYLGLGAGAFDIEGGRGSPPAAAAKVEFRYGKKLLFIGPAIGLLANVQGGILGYGGVYGDFRFGRLVVTPLGAVAGYHRGGSEDLGGALLFRASIEGAYELGNGSRLGLQFAHVSNAGMGKPNVNPGDNELLLTYSLPLELPW